jgi:hypothetical protein
VPGYPFGALEVGLECQSGAIGFAIWINMQDDACDLTPIRAGSIGIKQTHAGRRDAGVACPSQQR